MAKEEEKMLLFPRKGIFLRRKRREERKEGNVGPAEKRIEGSIISFSRKKKESRGGKKKSDFVYSFSSPSSFFSGGGVFSISYA